MISNSEECVYIYDVGFMSGKKTTVFANNMAEAENIAFHKSIEMFDGVLYVEFSVSNDEL